MSSSLPVLHGLLRHVLRLLVPLSVILTVYLYFYPVFLACAFSLPTSPTAPRSGLSSFFETVKLHTWSTATTSQPDNGTAPGLRVAPFRLLALGDPQLEGDTSIPNAHSDSSFPHLHSFLTRLVSRSDEYPTFRTSVKQALHDLVDFYFDDIPNTLESIRKRIDLFGNDFYLAHQYRTLRWWTVPTHVTVLGDLVGSQWIDDDEFESRAWRYWNRVFKDGERVPDDVAIWPQETYDVAGQLGESLYNETWQACILNVAGNHDIGYAGDLTKERMDRFERVYGKANYELRFELPPAMLSPEAAATIRDDTADEDGGSGASQQHDDRLIPELRIVLLNDMNLDTPVVDTDIQDQTYNFINSVINTATAVEYKGHFTVVLTHVPLYKPEGVCVDAPYFTFHESDGTLKEQNQLSADASKGFVEGIFGLSGDATAPGHGQGRRGVILNGHDHEGCDTYHFINQSQSHDDSDNSDNDDDGDGSADSDSKRGWQVRRWDEAVARGLVDDPSLPGVRELTVRSMMGDFGGNAGLLSAWFDEARWEWRYEFAQCALGTQHIWWAAHVVDLITVVAGGAYAVVSVLVLRARAQAPASKQEKEQERGREEKREAMNGGGFEVSTAAITTAATTTATTTTTSSTTKA